MTPRHLLLAAAMAAAGLGASADEYYGGMFAEELRSVRSREAVRAELMAAAERARPHSGRAAQAALPPGPDRATVRHEAALALRRGEIPRGEAQPS